jgi:hypothetical protein
MMIKKSVLLTAAMSMAMLFVGATAQAAYFDKDLACGGQARIYYKSPSPASTEAIIFAVGTAMSRDSYDNLAAAITNTYGYVVIILDNVPGSMTKQDGTKYRNCALELKSTLIGLLAGKGVTTSIAHWIMGGHSGGGQAAVLAVGSDPSLANAMIGLDPYNIEGTPRIAVPTLNWGFTETTCFVEKSDAAEAAYYYSDGRRAFYRVKKIYSWGPCGYSPKYYHCSFADGSCPACTNCMYTPSAFYTDVAKSVNKFVNAAFYGTWSKANLAVSTTTPTLLYVDSDAP